MSGQPRVPQPTARGEAISLAKCRHGESRRGFRSPEWLTWASMYRRCYLPSQPNYKDYGAKGVTVCDEWRGPGGYERFLAEVGRRPSPEHSIDRIDSSLGYQPGNCRWATSQEQNRNRSRTRWIEVDGERLCLQDWADRLGCKHTTISQRLRYGWSERRAVTEPVERRKP